VTVGAGSQPLPPIMACLAGEHRHMTALARLLEQRARQARGLNRGDYYLMRDIVGYLHDFPDGVHHPTEDILFRRLESRRPDLASEVNAARADHRTLSEETARLLDVLESAADGPSTETERTIRARSQALAVHQRRHMAFEQRKLFQAALADLQPSDWKVLSRRAGLHEDPLFGERVDARHRTLFEFLLETDRSLPATATASVIAAQERLIVAIDALEQGASASLAALGRAASGLNRETRRHLTGERRPSSLPGLAAWPLSYGLSLGRTAWDCGRSLVEIYAATTRSTWGALLSRQRE